MRNSSKPRTIKQTVAVLWLAFIGMSGNSSVWASETTTQSLFLKAERLAKMGRLDLNGAEANSLQNYALYPYLVFNQLNAQLTNLSANEIDQFTSRFPDSHLEGLLRFRFVQQLGKRKDWTLFLRYFDGIENPSTDMQCYYAEALFDNKQDRQAITLTADIWQAGRSQPDECDTAFRLFRSAGGLTSELALQRVLNALDANRWGLSGYALRFVNEDAHRRIADKARAIYRSPFKAVNLDTGFSKDQIAHMQRIGVQRAYKNDPYQALNLLLKLGEHFDVDHPENRALLSRVGVRVAKELDHHDRQKLAQLDPTFASSELTEWRIRLGLLKEDWSDVASLITKLPESLRSEPRWQYWSAMLPANNQAQNQLRSLSKKRSFYGFLAAAHIQQSAELNHEPFVKEAAKEERLKASLYYQRIVELVALDRYTVARSEWNRWIADLTQEERRHAAHLMNDIEWFQQGILGAAYQGFWNDMDLRFPEGYLPLFEKHANTSKIDSMWTQALARQESALFPWARSRVGARGLMQLMPRTAKQTAKSIGLTLKSNDSLFNDEFNIKLGTTYLAQMYKQFDNNRVFATAAYNAGPHRVKRWLKDKEHLPLDVWIELIPFDETRTYVQNVLSFAVIYAQRNGDDRDVVTPSEKARLTLALR